MTQEQIDKFFKGTDELQLKYADYVGKTSPTLIISQHVMPVQFMGQGVQLQYKTDYPFPNEIRDDIWAVFVSVFPLE